MARTVKLELHPLPTEGEGTTDLELFESFVAWYSLEEAVENGTLDMAASDEPRQ